MSDMIRALRSQWQQSDLPHKDPMGPVMDMNRALQRKKNEQYMMDTFVPQDPVVEGVQEIPVDPNSRSTRPHRSIFQEPRQRKRGFSIFQSNEGVNET